MATQFNIRKNVVMLCNRYPNIKDNYNELVVKYWTEIDGLFSLSNVKNSTPAESITRAFRKAVRLNEIELSKATREKRRRAEVEFKEEYSK